MRFSPFPEDAKREDGAAPVLPTAYPFVEAADPGQPWTVVNVPLGQAEADTTRRVLRVPLDSSDVAAANRSQELGRIAWGMGNEPVPAGLWAGFVFGAEEARLARCLADVGAEFPSGRYDGTGFVDSVIAQTELGATPSAVAGAVSLVGAGADEGAIVSALARLSRDPTRKVARCAEVALKAMAVARAGLERWTVEQRRLGAVSIGIASDVHRTVEAAAEEDRKREEAEREKDRERVEKAKKDARERAESEGSDEGEPAEGEDGDEAEGEGDDGHDDEGDPDESDGTADDTEGAEGDAPDHDPEDDEGDGDEQDDASDGPPSSAPETSSDEQDDDGEGEDDDAEGDEQDGETSKAEADDDAQASRSERHGSEPEAVKPPPETPEEREAREQRERANEERIRRAEQEAAAAEQERIAKEHADEAARQRRLESEKQRKATDTIERVRRGNTKKEEAATAAAKKEAEEGAMMSRVEARKEREEFKAAFGPAAAEAEKMIEVGCEEMAKRYRGLIEYRPHSGDAHWGSLSTLPVPMPVRVPRISAPKYRWSNEGAYLRAPHRLFTDGFAFRHNAGGRDGGSVLIDVSGSMSLTVEDVERIVRAAPAVNVAVYAGDHTSPGMTAGYLRVVAKDGKMVESQHLTFPFGANLCDGPALREWLAKQPMPRVWVSDGMVTGAGESVAMNLLGDTARICRAKSIVRVPNVAEAMKLFRKINPKSAALADRYEKEKADGSRV